MPSVTGGHVGVFADSHVHESGMLCFLTPGCRVNMDLAEALGKCCLLFRRELRLIAEEDNRVVGKCLPDIPVLAVGQIL
jgi:hypothetical protein